MLKNVFFDQITNVVVGSRSNVGQAPGSLELELWNLVVQQLNEDLNQVGVYNWLDWRVVLDREQTSQSNQCEQLHVQVFAVDHLAQVGKVSELLKRVKHKN